MTIEIALLGAERHGELTGPLRTAFGLHYNADRVERMQGLAEIITRIGAFDGQALVGSAGAFQFELTTPGGAVPCAGLTMVAVLPTHRRRGILTSMLRKHFEEAQARELPVSMLWASEASIYGRFGYGVASTSCSIALERSYSGFRKAFPQQGVLRLVDEAEAIATFSQVWDRVRPRTPGMLARSPAWWKHRRLYEMDKSSAPLQRVLLEIDGKPEGYALYRLLDKMPIPGIAETALGVVEAVGTSPRVTAQLWRYLCDIDLVRTVRADLLPVSHPLFHLLLDPRRLQMQVSDALWVRLLDVEAALSRRSWPVDQTVTFALHDSFCPWNSGVYRIGEGRVTRPHASPDLKLDAAALGSLYLGGMSARALADAGDIDELTEGAIDRADAFFRSAREPWCPEIF